MITQPLIKSGSGDVFHFIVKLYYETHHQTHFLSKAG